MADENVALKVAVERMTPTHSPAESRTSFKRISKAAPNESTPDSTPVRFSATKSKKRISEVFSFIRDTNPEILKVEPRPGNIMLGSPPRKGPRFATSTPKAFIDDSPFEPSFLDESISREFRLKIAMEENESIDSAYNIAPNPLKDAMFMISIVISTITMLAAGSSIPNEHIHWSIRCLERITDDFGNPPPNIQGILQQLKSYSGTTAIPEEPEPEQGEEGAA